MTTTAEIRGHSPIFTTTAAVATDASLYSFDIANHNSDSGAYYCEYIKSAVAGDGVIRLGTSDAPIMQNGSTEFRSLSSGDPVASVSASTLQDTWLKCGTPYDVTEGLKQITIDGVSSSDVSYTGNGTTPAIYPLAGKFGITGAYAGGMRDLQRWDVTDYAEAKQIIDDLMGP